ncbi:MAG: c-type cytochrome [Phenylobacterium sp.]|uniref:c-type cytochrome n=1 Tax=Phenylobacterium sp. TaxID=1871053 RepID=UPI001226BD85|nr:cytochrome c [Phenylobacterium sp.]TAJ70094.1 MAG: c-type cytochrome [Phenylobacterium sp.]
MKRLLKWAGLGLAGIAALLLIVIGGAFAVSEAMIRWPVDRPKVQLMASSDPGAVARGARVAKLNGCHDCHGEKLQGLLFHDEMPIIRAWGPNLSRAVAEQTDSELDAAIRHGVAANGRRLWMMPSSAFAHLSDRETADLLAYLRTYKPTGEKQPRFQVGPVGRLGVLLGQFKSEPDMIAANGGALKIADLGPEHARGRDLARACVECHGQSLEGNKTMKSPDLSIVASYDPADFARLLRTGVAAGDRKVGLMTQIAPARFGGLSSDEISALQGYLKARAARQIAMADVTSAGAQQP